MSSGMPANIVHAFTHIDNLTGGSGADTFALTTAGSSLAGTLDGGGGTNAINGFNQAQFWAINNPNAGTVGTTAGTPANLINAFQNIQTLNGGTGPDTFQFTATTGFMNTINGGTGTSTIIGPAQANTWNITGTNTGNISGTLTTFNASTGTLNLTGGGSGDTFQFLTAGTINGTIDGTGNGAGRRPRPSSVPTPRASGPSPAPTRAPSARPAPPPPTSSMRSPISPI